jgi:hypothetical protein
MSMYIITIEFTKIKYLDNYIAKTYTIKEKELSSLCQMLGSLYYSFASFFNLFVNIDFD